MSNSFSRQDLLIARRRYSRLCFDARLPACDNVTLIHRLRGGEMSFFGAFAKWPPTPKTSDYWGRPEVFGAQSE
jgi:hypothetical protein